MSNRITGLNPYIEAADPNRGGLGAFNAAFGNSAEKFAAGRELDADGQIKANWKDRLFGHSTEELTEEYYKSRERQLRNDPRVQALQAEGGSVGVTTTGAQIVKRTNDLNRLKEARTAANVAGFPEASQLDDPDAIYAAITKGTKREAKTTKENDRDYAQSLVTDTREYNKGLLETENLRQERRDARARLDRLEERRSTAEINRMNMQLEYARMAQNDLYRQQDKKDKALMLLIQGLQNLGTGFTI